MYMLYTSSAIDQHARARVANVVRNPYAERWLSKRLFQKKVFVFVMVEEIISIDMRAVSRGLIAVTN